MRSVWYVLEDGTVVDPNEVAHDDKGALRHKGGQLVAMRDGVPHTSGVEIGEDGKASPAKVMRPARTGVPYLTRDAQTNPLDHDGDGNPGGSAKPAGDVDDIAALRAEYNKVFDKKPFPGWDAETLRAKIVAHGKAD